MTDTAALEWLMTNADKAKEYDSFSDWCASDEAKPMGELYAKYVWLPKYWECLKERGFVPFQVLEYPKARAYTDLFDSAKLVKSVTSKTYRGSRAVTRDGSSLDGYIYCGTQGIEPSICGSYGGKRDLSKTQTYGDGLPLRQHYGGEFYSLYVRPIVRIPTFPSGTKFALELGTFQAIKRDDGTVLVVSNGRTGIGHDWVAILDEGDSLESLLSIEDQAFLAAERKAEKEAWG